MVSNIFFHLVGGLFILWIVSLAVQLFSLIHFCLYFKKIPKSSGVMLSWGSTDYERERVMDLEWSSPLHR